MQSKGRSKSKAAVEYMTISYRNLLTVLPKSLSFRLGGLNGQGTTLNEWMNNTGINLRSDYFKAFVEILCLADAYSLW